MVHPGLFLGLFAAKKAIAVTVYYSLKQYGFARAYRRLLEANIRLTPASQQPTVRRLVRSGFDAPGKAAELLHNSDVYAFAQRLAKELTGAGGVLSKVESVAGALLASQTAAASFFSVLQREADADNSKKKTMNKKTKNTANEGQKKQTEGESSGSSKKESGAR